MKSSHSELNNQIDGSFSAGYLGYEEDPGNVRVYQILDTDTSIAATYSITTSSEI